MSNRDPFRLGQRVVFKDQPELGVWGFDHYSSDYGCLWAWITPRHDVPTGLARVAEHAMIAVLSKTLTHYTIIGEPIHGL